VVVGRASRLPSRRTRARRPGTHRRDACATTGHLAELIDGDDVGVIEAGQGAASRGEAFGEAGVGHGLGRRIFNATRRSKAGWRAL